MKNDCDSFNLDDILIGKEEENLNKKISKFIRLKKRKRRAKRHLSLYGKLSVYITRGILPTMSEETEMQAVFSLCPFFLELIQYLNISIKKINSISVFYPLFLFF